MKLCIIHRWLKLCISIVYIDGQFWQIYQGEYDVHTKLIGAQSWYSKTFLNRVTNINCTHVQIMNIAIFDLINIDYQIKHTYVRTCTCN